MIINEFNTVLKSASDEIVVKKSRFICNVKPVSDEKEALDFIKQVCENHKSAKHNVIAYIISGDTETQRASDDGEPQGTAGIPVLEVIRREELVNVCVVVTRYFGGILLGAAGLIRAYSGAAKCGLSKACICRMALYKQAVINIDYSNLGKTLNIMSSLGNTILNTQYTETIKLFLKIRYDRLDKSINAINKLTNGHSMVEYINDFYDVY